MTWTQLPLRSRSTWGWSPHFGAQVSRDIGPLTPTLSPKLLAV